MPRSPQARFDPIIMPYMKALSALYDQGLATPILIQIREASSASMSDAALSLPDSTIERRAPVSKAS